MNSFAVQVYDTPDKKDLFPLCFYTSVTFKHQASFIFPVQLTINMVSMLLKEFERIHKTTCRCARMQYQNPNEPFLGQLLLVSSVPTHSGLPESDSVNNYGILYYSNLKSQYLLTKAKITHYYQTVAALRCI